MVFREIGSEFELENPGNEGGSLSWTPQCQDFCWTFSGRTAIEAVLKDLDNVKKALLPAYCCDSMIEPFRQAEIEVAFYGVDYHEGLRICVDIPADCDVILWCSYFGFRQDYPEEQLRSFRARGGVVIEDITHSLLSCVQSHSESDYLVASTRKWFPVYCGGFCGKRSGTLRCKPDAEPGQEFLSLRHEAMGLKKQYIDAGYMGDKQKFLNLYSRANSILAGTYSCRKADEASLRMLRCLDVEQIRRRRRENAEVLYEGLAGCAHIVPMFRFQDMDCPLFLPVLIDGGCRDIIRKKLVDAAIYCPTHWPHPAAECSSNLYDLELSLICDQRYNADDMRRILQVLNS